jgi:SAM-dependent methyltransferase
MTRDWDDLADELGSKAVADGEPTRWYDELWSAAGRGEVPLPWDHTDPHPVLAEWLSRWQADRPGGRAVVVGCGLGADSEHLARHGWETTAFDISPAAVAAVRQRYPDSPVDYREGNLLDLAGSSADLVGAFDLVVEIYTLQALHPSLRTAAVAGVRGLLAPGGTALVVQVVRRDEEPLSDEPPWTLSRAEMEAVAGDGVVLESIVEVLPEGRVRPLWEMVLTRA